MQAFIAPSPFLGVTPPRRRPRCRTSITASASPDVVVIGAGIAGLSTAYELAQKGASVQILTSPTRKPAANASAGMLAPEAENLSGDMRRLCRASRQMYPDFVRRLQRLVDVDVNYVSRNDFLIPSMTYLSGPDVLTGDVLRLVEPALGPNVKAARRSPCDASVDSRRLMRALYEACVALGVRIEEVEVQSVIVAPDARSVQAVQTKLNRVVGGHYLIASGAWTGRLLPEIPVRPVKGQMLNLAAPEDDSTRLNHVLFGHGVYIVPKNNGNEFYVGATVEHAGFDTKTTAGGISYLLNKAVEFVPKLAEYEIREMWSGLRPATPDLLPILGHSDYHNVSIASGYYRNGILLAPAASSIAAATVLGEVDLLPRDLRDLADRFSYQRLLSADDGKLGIQKDMHAKKLITDGSPSPEAKTDQRSTMLSDDSKAFKVWKVNKDGTHEPVPPSDRFLRRHDDLIRGSVQATSEQASKPPVSESVVSASSSDESKMVKLWKMNKDGTSEPVYSSHRFLRRHDELLGGSFGATSEQASICPISESMVSPSQRLTSTDHETYQGGEGFQSHIENAENISGQNDAYDDVLRKRDNADEVMSHAMAANRAFGRKKSYLETEGSVQLSISEEEVIAFDAALKEGVEDMRRLERHFDQNDPSVRATRAEKEKLESEAADGGLPVNGIAVPSLADGVSSESSNGYF